MIHAPNEIDFGGVPLPDIAEDVGDLVPVYLGELSVSNGDELEAEDGEDIS